MDAHIHLFVNDKCTISKQYSMHIEILSEERLRMEFKKLYKMSKIYIEILNVKKEYIDVKSGELICVRLNRLIK